VYKKLLFILVLFSAATNAQQVNNPQQILNQANKSFFIQNNGQWDSEVKYLTRIGGMNAWITNSGVVYDYYHIDNNLDKPKSLGKSLKGKQNYGIKNAILYGHIVKMEMVNAERNIISIGNNQREGYYNYFVGNDHSKWAGNVPLFDNVEIQGVYKNIDIKYYYDNGMLRYDYKAKPGADISQIKFNFEGQNGISINPNGELVLKTSIGEVTNGKIYAYQVESGTQKEVQCKFQQYEDGTIGLKTENYNTNKELIIDPLVYSTFIGGSGNDKGTSIAIDHSGDAYLTGETQSANYPASVGSYQDTLHGIQNVFVTKLTSAGNGLVYSTFIGIGGAFDEEATSIAVDFNGNAYITGYAIPVYYPTTSGAYQAATSGGGTSAFVTKLSPTGSTLVYSAIIGEGVGNSIAIDSYGNSYITGWTKSSNYPTTNNAYQTTLGSSYGNAFVTKLNSAGSALIYSTLIGGSGNTSFETGDQGNSIAIDINGNAFITGQASSLNYPTTPGVFQTTFAGSNFDAFVTKLNPSGSELLYSSYLGGNSYDIGNSIAIDAGGNAYITGGTYSSNYPVTNGAFQNTLGGYENVFVTKMNPAGSALIYSTFIGGSGISNGGTSFGGYGDQGNSIIIDSSMNAYITGYTNSTDFPTTKDAFQTSLGGSQNQNTFVTKLNSTGSVLLYSTYLGGNGWDYSQSIAIDTSGNCFTTGYTNSSNFPTSSGAYQTTYGGGQYDMFVTKLNLSPATIVLTDGPFIPNKFELMQNFPNPFNPSTIIRYALPFSSSVKIEVYNMLGQKVRELLNGQKKAGYYEVNFNTTGLSSGVYFYMIYAQSVDGKSEFRDTKKMVLLK
jgi:hypothetical protein